MAKVCDLLGLSVPTETCSSICKAIGEGNDSKSRLHHFSFGESEAGNINSILFVCLQTGDVFHANSSFRRIAAADGKNPYTVMYSVSKD